MKQNIALVAATVMLLTLFAGCTNTDLSNPSQPNPTEGQQATDTMPSETTEETTALDLNVPLFVADTYDSTYVYVNANGDSVAAPIGFYGKNGLAAAASADGLVGFVDTEGVFVIEPQFEDAGPFGSNGLAPVAIDIEDSFDDAWGFINEQGEIVIPCKYSYVSAFYDNGYAIVAADSKQGVIDSHGNTCIDMKYADIHITDNYVFAEEYIDGYQTPLILDYNGNIFERTSENVILNYANGIITKSVPNPDENSFTKYILENGTYREVIHSVQNDEYPAVYSMCHAEILCYTLERKQVATTQTGYGIKISYNGTDLSSYEYDHYRLSSDMEYLLAFRFHDPRGNSCHTDIYDLNTGKKTAENVSHIHPYIAQIQPFPSGYFLTRSENTTGSICYGVVDHTGKVIMEPIYEEIIPYTYKSIAPGF